MVARRAVLISFNWLKLLSLSQDVIGSVRAKINKAFKFGYAKTLHSFRASISVSGITADELPFHCLTHESYSVLNVTAWGRSPLNRSTALASSSGTITSFPSLTHSLGIRWRRPSVMLCDGLFTNLSSNSDTTWNKNSSKRVIL